MAVVAVTAADAELGAKVKAAAAVVLILAISTTQLPATCNVTKVDRPTVVKRLALSPRR